MEKALVCTYLHSGIWYLSEINTHLLVMHALQIVARLGVQLKSGEPHSPLGLCIRGLFYFDLFLQNNVAICGEILLGSGTSFFLSFFLSLRLASLFPTRDLL